jgi:hypothetical protein
MDDKSAQWMGVTEAARAWGVSTRRVRTLCESGLLLGAEKPGGRWRIPADTPRPADGRASRGFGIAPDRVALFREIDALRDELARRRPLSPAEKARLRDEFAGAQRGVLQNIGNSFQANPPPVEPPNAFASAITDILFDNFAALWEALGIVDGLAMYSDAKDIVANELHKPAGSAARIINAIKEDALQAGGDKDYTIDIGV